MLTPLSRLAAVLTSRYSLTSAKTLSAAYTAVHGIEPDAVVEDTFSAAYAAVRG